VVLYKTVGNMNVFADSSTRDRILQEFSVKDPQEEPGCCDITMQRFTQSPPAAWRCRHCSGDQCQRGLRWQLTGAGADPDWGDRRPPRKTYESNFFHHDSVQFGKQHSRYESILPFIVLSRLDWQISLKSPPPLTLLAGSAPGPVILCLVKWY